MDRNVTIFDIAPGLNIGARLYSKKAGRTQTGAIFSEVASISKTCLNVAPVK